MPDLKVPSLQIRELSVTGVWEFTPRQLGDERGVFLEWYTAASLAQVSGRELDLRQANASTSKAGAIRGIHYADTPPGQAKYVFCPRGAILDVVVDLRVGSPTFGRHDTVLLDDVTRRSIFISEGIGHGFCSLEDDSTVVYLCSAPYTPEREHGIDPFDAALAIDWPRTGRDGRAINATVSAKDASAPGFLQSRDAGALPHIDEVERFITALSLDQT